MIRRLPGRRLAAGLFLCSVAAFLASPLGWSWSFVDLEVYRGGGQALLDGGRLYQMRFHGFLDFTYPPLAALVFTPLALLPLTVLKALVTFVNIALLPVILRLALRLAPVSSWLTGEQATRVALVAAAAALWLEPMWSTLGYGQINLVIAALVLGDLARPDGARGKGVAIGLAAGLKLTPATFAVYLLLTRRTRAAAVASVTFIVTVAAGFALVPRDAADFWGGAFLDPGRVGRIENSVNQSLRGAFARLFHSGDVQTWWIPAALVIALLGMGLATRAGRRGDEAAGFSICALTGLLASPVSWSHHWVLAIPVLLLFLVRAARSGSRAGLAVAGAAAVLGYSEMVHWAPHHAHAELRLGATQLLAADAYVIAALLAIAAVSAAGLWARRPGVRLRVRTVRAASPPLSAEPGP